MAQIERVTFSDEVIMPLNEKDTRAVDWLMNQRNNPTSAPAVGSVGDDVSFSRRISQINSIFTLLELMPEEAPPAGLVERTLAKLHGTASEGTISTRSAVAAASQPNA
jgi:hypothetical protein